MDSGEVATKNAGATTGYRIAASLVPDVVAIIDVGLLLVAACVAYLFYVPYNPDFFDHYVFCVVFIAGVTVLMLHRSGLYEFDAILRPIGKSDMMLVSVLSAFLFFLTIAFSLKVSQVYSRVWMYAFAGGGTALLVIARLSLASLLKGLARRRVIERNLVVLGEGQQAVRFLTAFQEKTPAFSKIARVFAPGWGTGTDSPSTPPPPEIAGFPVAGDATDMLGYLRSHRVDDIVIAMPIDGNAASVEIIDRLRELPVNIYISSQLTDFQLRFKPVLGHPDALPLFEVVSRPISGWSALIKTLEDYVLATILLILLAPLLAIIAIAIKIDSPGPVFFMQPRLGFNNKEFRIFKFRSMYHREIPEKVVKQAQKGDPRVTRVGRFIRRTSLDELPQMLNVLNGTMSIVGPRPHALSHNEDYGRLIRGYFARHKVKPGITGWAQVNNLRGETESLSKMEARVEYDVYYAENWSLLFDLKILIMTLLIVLFQKEAY